MVRWAPVACKPGPRACPAGEQFIAGAPETFAEAAQISRSRDGAAPRIGPSPAARCFRVADAGRFCGSPASGVYRTASSMGVQRAQLVASACAFQESSEPFAGLRRSTRGAIAAPTSSGRESATAAVDGGASHAKGTRAGVRWSLPTECQSASIVGATSHHARMWIRMYVSLARVVFFVPLHFYLPMFVRASWCLSIAASLCLYVSLSLCAMDC